MQISNIERAVQEYLAAAERTGFRESVERDLGVELPDGSLVRTDITNPKGEVKVEFIRVTCGVDAETGDVVIEAHASEDLENADIGTLWLEGENQDGRPVDIAVPLGQIKDGKATLRIPAAKLNNIPIDLLSATAAAAEAELAESMSGEQDESDYVTVLQPPEPVEEPVVAIDAVVPLLSLAAETVGAAASARQHVLLDGDETGLSVRLKMPAQGDATLILEGEEALVDALVSLEISDRDGKTVLSIIASLEKDPDDPRPTAIFSVGADFSLPPGCSAAVRPIDAADLNSGDLAALDWSIAQTVDNGLRERLKSLRDAVSGTHGS